MGLAFRLSGAAIALGLVVQGAQAQDNPVTLPPIVVSPTTLPTPISETASSVTLITAQDIEQRQLRTVSEALGVVPGLNVVQTGGSGGQTAVFIRGTNANHVKVLIDGVDVGDPSVTNGAFDFGHLLTGDIERIEVLRGPQSGLYGADAIGGVISITTKKGEGPLKLSGMVEGGSFGTFNQTASARGAQGNISYAFNVLHYQAQNVPVTPLNQLAPGEVRNNDSYNNWTYSTKLGADLSDTLSANFIGRYTDARHGLTNDDCANFFPCVPEPSQSTQKNKNLYTRGELVWSPFGDRFKNYLGVNYTDQRQMFANPNADSGFTSPAVLPPTDTIGQRFKVDWRGVGQITSAQTVVAGLEAQRDSIDTNSTGIIDPAFNFTPTETTASIQNRAGWLELQSNFAERFFLASNIRYDDNEKFGGHTTYRVAPAFIMPVTDTKLKASYGTGFKAPTLYQLYANTLPFILANPLLQPEESTGYDFGFEQALWHNRVQFGVTYYNNDIRNLIAFVSDPAFVGTDVNVDNSRIHGYEAFAAVNITSDLKLRGDYTYTHIDASSSAALQRRPAHKYSVTGTWTPMPALDISASIVTVSSFFDLFDRSNTYAQWTSGYTVVNVAATYRVNDRLEVFARADNLFNDQYQDPTGYMRPGLGVYGGIRVMTEVAAPTGRMAAK